MPSIVEQRAPSPSPAILESKSFAEILFAGRVAAEQEKLIGEFAEELLNITTQASDNEILNGTIPQGYGDSVATKVLNRLFKISRPTSQFFFKLTREYVESKDRKTAALLKCMNGGLFAEACCLVVNEENEARRKVNEIPSNAFKGATGATSLALDRKALKGVVNSIRGGVMSARDFNTSRS